MRILDSLHPVSQKTDPSSNEGFCDAEVIGGLRAEPPVIMVFPSGVPSRRRKLTPVRKTVLLAVTAIACVLFALNSREPYSNSAGDVKPLKAGALVGDASEFGAVARPCAAAVQHLLQLNVKLLALDFDLTIADIHTGGYWESTAHELAGHVRVEMKCLIQLSLAQGIYAAVTSFSIQADLIREVLAEAIPVAQNITVRGGRNRSEAEGKKKQLAEAIEDVTAASGDRGVVASTTILIDDDRHNIERAKADGYKALWFDPDNVTRFFAAMMAL